MSKAASRHPSSAGDQDYAVVIVVKDDPFQADSTATQPITILGEIGEWLKAPDGGQIPEQNTFALLGDYFSPPMDDAFDRAFQPLLDGSVRGRRLYIYFAGHGIRVDRDAAMLLGTGSSLGPTALPVRRFADFFRNSGAFAEVVLLADLVWPDHPMHAVEYFPQWTSESSTGPDTAHFYAMTQPSDAKAETNAEHRAPDEWMLSRAVLEGLRGAAAGTGELVSSVTLAGFLKRRVSPQPEIFEGGRPIIFGGSPTTSGVEVERVAAQSDDPARIDTLGRRPFAEVLGARIREVRRTGQDPSEERRRKGQAAEQTYSTFMMNVHGEWGTGKTSLLALLKEFLQKPRGTDDKPWVVIDFNAWRHQRLQPPWWSLISEVYRQSRRQLENRGWLLRFRWLLWRARADLLPAVGSALLIAIAVGLVAGVFDHRPTASKASAPDLATARKMVDLALKSPGTPESKALAKAAAAALQGDATTGSSVLPDADLALKLLMALLSVGGAIFALSRSLVFGSARAAQTYMELRTDPLRPIVALFNRLVAAVERPIVIFIDDLDRCDAAYVVQLLEGIQTLFREVAITYVVTADRNWISSCFETKYAEFSKTMAEPGRPLGYLFLDKMFQVSIALPRLSRSKRKEYFDALLAAAGTNDARTVEELQKHAEEKALDELKDARTQEELEAKIRMVDTSDKVREQAMRAAAATRITTAEALTESEHRLQAFSELLESNPRAMKRFVNAVGLKQAANFLQECSVSQGELARWTVLESRWPVLAEFLARHPHWITDLASASVPRGMAVPDELKALFTDAEVTRVVRGTIGGSSQLTAATVGQLAGRVPATDDPHAAGATAEVDGHNYAGIRSELPTSARQPR